MGRFHRTAAALLAVAAAAHVVFGLHQAGRLPADDIYGYFLPNVLHAIHAVHDGGRGLFWNPFQCCGEPFFGNGATGLLYPLHWLFLVLEPNRAVHVVQAANMAIGGAGMIAALLLTAPWPVLLSLVLCYLVLLPYGWARYGAIRRRREQQAPAGEA